MTYTWSGFHGVAYVKGEVDDVTGGGDTLVSNGPKVTVHKSSGTYSVGFGDTNGHTYHGFAELYNKRGQPISGSLGQQTQTASCS